MEISKESKIVVAGAGSVGCFLGGLLAADGRNIAFLGRERIKAEIDQHGLRVSDLTGVDHHLSPEKVVMDVSPVVLADAAVILVTVKSGATEEMARLIKRHASSDAVVVSLQNGVTNANVLTEILDGQTVVAGMVPYNIVQMGEGRFHRGTSGAVMVSAGIPGLADLISTPFLKVVEDVDMPAVLWGKLLINLNNALNALSGIPLRDQFEQQSWRALLADQMAEALPLLKLAGIEPKSAIPIPPKIAPHLMRLPTPIFRRLASRMLKIDPKARSSMWEDLELGRMTEIDQLQGSIVALAESFGKQAPLNERVLSLIRSAEQKGIGSPNLSVASIRDY